MALLHKLPCFYDILLYADRTEFSNTLANGQISIADVQPKIKENDLIYMSIMLRNSINIYDRNYPGYIYALYEWCIYVSRKANVYEP
jgi:hypothetical protein